MRPSALWLTSLTLLAGTAAVTAVASQPEALRFDAWWGGMNAARISFVADEEGQRYHGHLSIRTQGMVHWMTGIDVDADGWGTLDASGFHPTRFAERSASKDSERRLEMHFDGPEGVAVKTLDFLRPLNGSDPALGEDDLPPTPEALRKSVLDPVAALLEVGRRSLDGERQFTLPVYDGRRRYDLEVKAVGPGRHDIEGKSYETLDLSVIFHPVTGFKPDSFDLWKDAAFDVYVGRESRLPLKIVTDSFAAATVIDVKELQLPRS